MDNRKFILFIALSTLILLGYTQLMAVLFPPPPRPQVAQKKDDKGDDKAKPPKQQPAVAANQQHTDQPGEQPDQPEPQDQAKPPAQPAGAAAAAIAQAPLQRVVLGSLDRKSGARMAVTLVNRGAAIERIELNNPRYLDINDRTGYLGHLSPKNVASGGCEVQVVVPGSPAAIAGLQVGDVITAIDGAAIKSDADLQPALGKTEPGDTVKLTVERGPAAARKSIQISATLKREPLQLVRPELGTEPQEALKPGVDQLSYVMTLERLGADELLPKETELKGISLRDANWEITKQSPWEVEFTREIPDRQIAVVKRYRLVQVSKDHLADDDFKAYHLEFDIEIRNSAPEPREISYRLDGPTGMLTEGWWYTRKITREGRVIGTPGLRDVALRTENKTFCVAGVSIVKNQEKGETQRNALEQSGGAVNRLAYIGVDTQYFASVLIPQNDKGEQRYAFWEGVAVGTKPDDKARLQLTNITSRLVSMKRTVAAGETLKHSFVLFAGPKRPSLLAQYGPEDYPGDVTLKSLIYYGWSIWSWFAVPLSQLLHLFYAVVRNYGIAVIMLTVLVRLCMFPLSRKQALNAQKMQELQPEMKRIAEKYKKELDKRSKAMQDLYRKHNYSPLAGCLPMFIQLPIFIGLYRALMVDIELRQAPLIPGIHWCSNLAAPDMLLYWKDWLPILVGETGFLGPYLNILPLMTVGLFVWQQKMFMPPPADDNAAMQQKMMQYMMIFMAFLFFKVPSGLCLYFIASSLWGIAERKILPKKDAPSAPTKASDTKAGSSTKQTVPPQSNNGASGRGNKRRKKQKR